MCLEFSTGAHSLGSLGAIGSICESCRTPKAAGSSIQRDICRDICFCPSFLHVRRFWFDMAIYDQCFMMNTFQNPVLWFLVLSFPIAMAAAIPGALSWKPVTSHGQLITQSLCANAERLNTEQHLHVELLSWNTCQEYPNVSQQKTKVG